MGKIKTFRGLIESGEQDQIHLAGGDSDTGYKITKFQLFPKFVGSNTTGSEYNSLVNVYKVKQTTLTNMTADFSDETLLAAGQYYSEVSGSPAYVIGEQGSVIFDNEIINQDIFVVHDNFHGDNSAINYYIEMEEIKVKDAELAVINYAAALLHGE